jgi:hypothetical protein
MGLLTGSVWFHGGLSSGADWRSSLFDFGTGVQTFQAADSGRVLEETFQFPGSGRAIIEYFECDATLPTGVKYISWDNGPPEPGPP